MSFSPLIQNLINSLKCLPGVGTKTAQRMAFELLMDDRNPGLKLAGALTEALTQVQQCSSCRTLSETPLCSICSNPKRDEALLCIVESPIDLLAIEQSSHFQGLYFVLGGHLSPLDGIGPHELKLDELTDKLNNSGIREVILAINPTVEGQATCHYLTELARHHGKTISQIAYGVPFGGELEWVNHTTLNHAFHARQVIPHDTPQD